MRRRIARSGNDLLLGLARGSGAGLLEFKARLLRVSQL